MPHGATVFKNIEANYCTVILFGIIDQIFKLQHYLYISSRIFSGYIIIAVLIGYFLFNLCGICVHVCVRVSIHYGRLLTTVWLLHLSGSLFFFLVSRKIILFHRYSSSNYSYRLEGMNKVVIVSESFSTAVMI